MIRSVLALLVSLSMLLPASAFALAVLGVSATNTDAGEKAYISTSLVDPGTNVLFSVENPIGEIISINAFAEADGVARAVFSDNYTTNSGVYKLTAKSDSYEVADSTFVVSPSKISSSESTFEAEKNLLTPGESTTIRLLLRDENQNPITDNPITLLSSRNTDELFSIQGSNSTDEHGSLEFSFRPSKEGVSILSFVNLVTGNAFESKVEIKVVDQFADSKSSSLKSVVDLFSANLTITGDGLSISGLPQEAKVGEMLSPVISSIDEDYLGTIHFDSTDSDADLPFDYTMKQLDGASHEFKYGVIFKTPGVHRITVTDMNNPALSVQSTVNVSNGTPTSIKKEVNKDIQITSPQNNAILSKKSFDVIGSGPPDSSVTLYNKGKELAKVSTNKSGSFFLNTGILSEGGHAFKASASINGKESVSSEVRVTVDVSPPLIQSVSYKPEFPRMGDEVVIILKTNEEANVANMMVYDQNIAMEMGGEKNTYTAFFDAQKSGNLQVKFELGDKYSNSHIYNNNLQIPINKLAESKDIEIEAGAEMDLSSFPGEFEIEGRIKLDGVILIWEDQLEASSYDVYMNPEGYSSTKINEHLITDSIFVYTGALFEGPTIFRVIANGEDQKISEPLMAEVGSDGRLVFHQNYQPQVGAVGRMQKQQGLTQQELLITIPYLDILKGLKKSKDEPEKIDQVKKEEPVVAEPKKKFKMVVAPPKEDDSSEDVASPPSSVKTIPVEQKKEVPELQKKKEEPKVLQDEVETLTESGMEHIFIFGMGLVLIGVVYEGIWAYQLSQKEKNK